MIIPVEIIAILITQVFGFGGVIYRLAKIEERVKVHIETFERHDDRLKSLEAGE